MFMNAEPYSGPEAPPTLEIIAIERTLKVSLIVVGSSFWFCCKVFQKIYFSVKLRKKTERTE